MIPTFGWIARKGLELCLTDPGTGLVVHHFRQDVTCTCGQKRWSEWLAQCGFELAVLAKN